jgi:hypothetical protein
MGSRQKAVIAFLPVCADPMLDQWIPDDDLDRQICYNGDCDCTVLNLNMGMSKQRLWQNNCAILQGMTILYNKKHPLISKTKVTKQAISFYYVLGAGKPVPTVPSDQRLYSAQQRATGKVGRPDVVNRQD